MYSLCCFSGIAFRLQTPPLPHISRHYTWKVLKIDEMHSEAFLMTELFSVLRSVNIEAKGRSKNSVSA